MLMSQYDWMEWVFAPTLAWAPWPVVIWYPWNSNRIQYESTNQEWERWPNVWMSALLNARYYYTPSSGACVALPNLLGYRGPTIVKPVLWPGPNPGAGALGGSGQGLYCLVEVPPLLASLYKSPEPCVTSGEAHWRAGSMHLHHVLGTSQVWAHALTYTLLRGTDPNCIIAALRAHLDHPEPRPTQGMGRGMYP